MTYQHPLAYLLGLEGIALLRAYHGGADREFVQARLAEVRRLLDAPELAGPGVEVGAVDTVTGYREWSSTYDQPGNGLFDQDAPIIDEILGAAPAGLVLDAACGTGRHAERLAAQGHRIIGVDSSPDMLALARERVPDGDFRTGDLHKLPVSDGEVDAVVCTLALTHVPSLGPVLAEFARVLRPGGDLVIADVHPELVLRGSVPKATAPGGGPGLVPSYIHQVGDYLRAALPLGLQVRRCEEVRPPVTTDEPAPVTSLDPGGWERWPWSLIDLVPEAARASAAPTTLVWHFQLADS